ncbi:hypothetical protein [Enhygromyxa salina]|nr:hypothetical protein [Enhygromyxa salina]
MVVVPIAVVVLCSGCPEPEAEPEAEPAADCSAQTPSDTSTLPERELVLGEVVDGTFTPWAEGEQVTAVYGFQGAPMITPWFQIPATTGDEDGACWHLTYEHLDAEGEVSEEHGAYSGGLVFTLVGEVMRTGPLFDITYADAGSTERLRVTVSTPEFVAIEELSITVN